MIFECVGTSFHIRLGEVHQKDVRGDSCRDCHIERADRGVVLADDHRYDGLLNRPLAGHHNSCSALVFLDRNFLGSEEHIAHLIDADSSSSSAIQIGCRR